jgi:hypothetical protein
MRPDALTGTLDLKFPARFAVFAGFTEFTEFAEFARGSFFENQLKKPIYFTVDI